VPRVDLEQDNDGRQLNQASDAAAVLQDALIRAADRERQLQMQLDKMQGEMLKLQTERSNWQKGLVYFKWELEMKQRDSRFHHF